MIGEYSIFGVTFNIDDYFPYTEDFIMFLINLGVTDLRNLSYDQYHAIMNYGKSHYVEIY